MAQQQFFKYQDEVLSFELGESQLGLLKPRRYAGFDYYRKYTDVDGYHLELRHQLTGVVKYDKTPPHASLGQFGVILTQHGVVIHDSNIIDVIIPPNAGTGDRYDYVYVEHNYLETGVPNPAVYGVIPGEALDGSFPSSLTYPEKQTIIGYIYGQFVDGVYTMQKYVPTSDVELFQDLDSVIHRLLGLPNGGSTPAFQASAFFKYIISMNKWEEGLVGYPRKYPADPAFNYIQDWRSLWYNMEIVDNKLKEINDAIEYALSVTEWVDIKSHASIPTSYLSSVGIYKVRRNGSNLEFMIAFEKKAVTVPVGTIVSIVFDQDVSVLKATLASLGMDIDNDGHIQPLFATKELVDNTGNPSRGLVPVSGGSTSTMSISYNQEFSGENLTIKLYNMAALTSSLKMFGGFITTPLNPTHPYF